MNRIVVVGLFVLCFFPAAGCSDADAKFRRFVKSHEQLNNPPSHSFCLVEMQRSNPEFLELMSGQVDGYNAIFHVKLLKNQKDPIGNYDNVNYENAMEMLDPLKNLSDFDWTNGRNNRYAFGVRRESENEYTLLGTEQREDTIVTKSTLAYAMVYNQCMIRDIDRLFNVIGFENEVESDEFENCVAVTLKHKSEPVTQTLYLDHDQGRCIGYTGSVDGKLTSKSFHRYIENEHGWTPYAEETYFLDVAGELRLSRICLFLQWGLSDELDVKKCRLSNYGFEEPEFAEDSSGGVLIWVLLAMALTIFGWLAWQKRIA